MLEQLLLPSLRRQLFIESLGVLGLIATVLYVGLLYCLAGWLAMADPYADFETCRQNSWRLLPGIW